MTPKADPTHLRLADGCPELDDDPCAELLGAARRQRARKQATVRQLEQKLAQALAEVAEAERLESRAKMAVQDFSDKGIEIPKDLLGLFEPAITQVTNRRLELHHIPFSEDTRAALLKEGWDVVRQGFKRNCAYLTLERPLSRIEHLIAEAEAAKIGDNVFFFNRILPLWGRPFTDPRTGLSPLPDPYVPDTWLQDSLPFDFNPDTS